VIEGTGAFNIAYGRWLRLFLPSHTKSGGQGLPRTIAIAIEIHLRSGTKLRKWMRCVLFIAQPYQVWGTRSPKDYSYHTLVFQRIHLRTLVGQRIHLRSLVPKRKCICAV
jgi:hypothetical protein